MPVGSGLTACVDRWDAIMPDTDDPWIDRDFESAVRQTAYFLWESDGRPHGREQQYWFAALDKCLRQRETDALLRQPFEDGAAGDDTQDTEPSPTGQRPDGTHRQN